MKSKNILEFAILSLFQALLALNILLFISQYYVILPIVSWGDWGYVHHADASENLRNAIFFAKGGLLNKYVISNHMPGVYFFLGIIFFLTGIPFIEPSVKFYSYISIYSALIWIFVHFFLLNTSLFLITRKKTLVNILLVFVIELYFLFFFEYYKVLSETIIPYFNLLSIVLFYLAIGKSRKLQSKYLFYSLFFKGIGLFFGLTNILFDAIFIILLVLVCIKNRVLPFEKNGVFISLVILALFIFRTDSIRDYYYWIIETNRTQVGDKFNIIGNMLFLEPGFWKFSAFGPVFDSPFYSVLLLAIYFFLKRKIDIYQLLFFLFLIFFFQTDSWRIPELGFTKRHQSYKTDANEAIGIFCFFLVISTLKLSSSKFITVFKFVKALILILAILLIVNLGSYKPGVEDAYEVFRKNLTASLEGKVCKQRFLFEEKNCKCLVMMTWLTDYYIFSDIKPCPYEFPNYSPHLKDDEKYMNRILSGIKEKKQSYLFLADEFHNDEKIFPSNFIQNIPQENCRKSKFDSGLILCNID